MVTFGSKVRDIHVPHFLKRPSVGVLPWVLESSVKKHLPSEIMHGKQIGHPSAGYRHGQGAHTKPDCDNIEVVERCEY